MVPKRLREAREAAGLSQAKLAELLEIEGVNMRSRMSNYEVGRFSPPFDFVLRVAKVLDYPEYYFYVLDDVVAQSLLDAYRSNGLVLKDNVKFHIEQEHQRLREQQAEASKILKQLNHNVKKLNECLGR